ncbi:YhcN/YlaJ family sporulation lipoprotein [Paenibacillus sp. DS2015]|uniref:YhcN/YlaJ family sporulation lipoprotein n=1 Tax=Paenibacillus sp. DS2015 TaxID=3373917 RepID=UPI003D24869F
MRTYLTLILMLSLLTSCGTASKDASPSPQSKPAPITMNNQQDQRTNQLSVKSNNTQEQQQDLSVKEHLETLAKRVPGVSNAHCVIMGNTVVVGIDVDGKLSRSRVGTIKYSVAEALRNDPRGMKALVTADMDLSHRISEMGKHIEKGQPISGFASELADIVGRIIPQLPKDVKTQQNTPSTKNLTTPINNKR